MKKKRKVESVLIEYHLNVVKDRQTNTHTHAEYEKHIIGNLCFSDIFDSTKKQFPISCRCLDNIEKCRQSLSGPKPD